MVTTAELVDKIRSEAPVVRIVNDDLGVDRTLTVVEGDIGVSDERLASYAARRIKIAEAVHEDPDAERQGLLGIERDGRILRWRRGKTLTYAVWRPSFDSDAEYEAVVAGMDAATAGWQSECGVTFEHVGDADHDPNLQLGDVVFPVLRQPGGGNTIAVAFFPDYEPPERIVVVFDGMFAPDPTFDPVGVMRHELGHVLGFRHEHIRPEAPDLFHRESYEEVVELTEYDPMSVMHYLGEGVGDPQLRFTEHDKFGARAVYGAPDARFEFCD